MGDKKVYTRLHIYDTADWVGRHQYKGSNDDTYSISIDEGPQQLLGELNKLLTDGKIFRKVVFTTHGNAGAIFFNHKQITWYELYHDFNAPHYERLFPFKNAKMYFEGCEVAAGDDGWKFLEAAGRTFFRVAGGAVLGWTSPGLGLPTFVPSIGGHTAHLSGSVRGVLVTPDDADGLIFNYWGEGWEERMTKRLMETGASEVEARSAVHDIDEARR